MNFAKPFHSIEPIKLSGADIGFWSGCPVTVKLSSKTWGVLDPQNPPPPLLYAPCYLRLVVGWCRIQRVTHL